MIGRGSTAVTWPLIFVRQPCEHLMPNHPPLDRKEIVINQLTSEGEGTGASRNF